MKLNLLFSLSLVFSGSSPLLGIGFPPQRPDKAMNASYDYEGIVALSNCSGSLVKFDDSKDQDYGMILTNGHCVGMMEPGEVRWNQNSYRRFTLLASDASPKAYVRAQRLLYGTLTKTDVALYQLKISLGDIRDQYGIEALVIDRSPPTGGEAIEIPSGYWKRTYSCFIEGIVFTLREGQWTFVDSIRYSQPGCEVVGGTSGSPILAAGSRTVLGINNTGNQSGQRCTLNNPCEVDENGDVYYEKGQNYGQQTYWFYGCRNDSGALDLDVEGCQLPKPQH